MKWVTVLDLTLGIAHTHDSGTMLEMSAITLAVSVKFEMRYSAL